MDEGELKVKQIERQYTHYSHLAIQSGKLAMPGWRIPTQQDFNVLRDYVASQGHTGNEATVLKSKIGWTPSFAQNGGIDHFFDQAIRCWEVRKHHPPIFLLLSASE